MKMKCLKSPSRKLLTWVFALLASSLRPGMEGALRGRGRGSICVDHS